MRYGFCALFTAACCTLYSDAPSIPQGKDSCPTDATRTVMTIDPKMRSLDYAQAFEILRKEKTSNKVAFELADGTTLSNVIDLTVIGNGTLILFKCTTTQGIKYQVIGVEKILAIHPL